MSAYFYIDADGKEEGPVQLEDMRGLVADGIVDLDHKVKREGQPGWLPVKKVPELARARPRMPSHVHPSAMAMPPPAAKPDNLGIVAILVLCFPVLGPFAALYFACTGKGAQALVLVLLTMASGTLWYALYARMLGQ